MSTASSSAKRSSSSSGRPPKASAPSSAGKEKEKKTSGGDSGAADHSQPIYTKTHDEQVDLLAQALLREYMHKKGYKESLASFDEESPRDANTVSSRKVMGDLMLLSADKQKAIKEQGLETIMEMLCYDRVTKKDQMARMGSLQTALSEELPPLFVAPPIEVPTPTARKKKEKKEKKKKKDTTIEGEEEGGENKKEKKKKNKKKSGGDDGVSSSVVGAVLSIDDLLDKETPPIEMGIPKTNTKRGKEGESGGEADGQAKRREVKFATTPADSDTEKVKRKKGKPSVSAAVDDGSASDSSASDGSSSSSASSRGSSSQKGSDSDDSDDDHHHHHHHHHHHQKDTERKQMTAAEGAGSTKTNKKAAADDTERSIDRGPSSHPNPLGPTLASNLIQLLVGEGRRVPSPFMRQGFHFNSVADCLELRYGLIQNEGGPCGVLAGVQAMVIKEFIDNFFMITTDIQRTVLAKALAEMLLLAQPTVSKVVVVTVAGGASPRFWAKDGGTLTEQRSFISNQMGRCGVTFNNREALEAFLAENVIGHVDDDAFPIEDANSADWCTQYGYGLLSFVVSLILSKGGVESVRKDMDSPEQPLIVEHGYCTQEITNLVITGFATSGVHDGLRDIGDGMVLKGFMREEMPVGFLSYLEYLGHVHVGRRAKRPKSAVWMVYHESHYSVLFMREDTRSSAEHSLAAEGVGHLDVYFYDQQGRQDSEIRLTITLDKTPLPQTRKDALVPYLNVILRTIDKWENARVKWNGTDPLL